MSVATASYPDRQDITLYKKPPIQRRNNSGELDVFEAANYFSSHDQPSLVTNKPNKENFTTNSCKDFQAWNPAGVRMSIDVPGRGSKSRVTETTQTGHSVQIVKEKIIKQTKQPSSPGGRIASFLTSLFNNTTSKKKKKPLQEDQIRPRRRRNSISYVDSRSIYSESKSVSGFRTPPPLYKTFFDDSKSLKDYKRVTQTPSLPKISNGSLSAFSNKINTSLTNGFADKEMVFSDKKIDFEVNDKIVKELEAKKAEDKNIAKDLECKKVFHHDDEGDDHSDTSSDLFELQNYDLGEFLSGLPVYETTNVDQIKNSAKPVCN